MVESVHEYLMVCRRRDDNRDAASKDDRLVVAVAKGAAVLTEIACYADDRVLSGCGILGIDTIDVCLEIKLFQVVKSKS